MKDQLGATPLSHRQITELASSLRLLFDRAPALVVLLSGPEHTITYANPAYLRLVRRDAVVGRTVREALPDLERQGFVSLLDQVFVSGEPFVGEGVLTRFFGDDGSLSPELYFDFVYQPVLSASGEVIGIFGQGTDVTARVHAAPALRESEARLELATKAAKLGIWDWNLETGEIHFGPRARSLWGFPDEGAVTEQMMTAAMHPDDAPETNARFARAVDPETRDVSPYEYRICLADGGVRWIRAHASPLFEERGGVLVATRYVGTMEDITDAKTREERLRASEGRLRLALDAGRMAVWAIDPSGQMQVTAESNRLLGLPPDARPTLEEIQARYYPGEFERLQQIGTDALARGERYVELEYRHFWPNGEVRWLLVRAEFLLSAEGVPQGAIGVAMDITDRRESEERLKLLAREVDHRANNLLAVVQGSITLSEAPTAAELKQVMLGRVAALAKAHQLLASSRWVGADLKRLVEEELQPYCGHDDGYADILGDSVALSPAVAQGMAMALHELATNAVKHGALSRPGGGVKVRWTGGDRGEPLVLTWIEHGGSPVSEPKRSGTGLKVIGRALAGALGGRAALEWNPAGLVCRIEVAPIAPEGSPIS